MNTSTRTNTSFIDLDSDRARTVLPPNDEQASLAQFSRTLFFSRQYDKALEHLLELSEQRGNVDPRVVHNLSITSYARAVSVASSPPPPPYPVSPPSNALVSLCDQRMEFLDSLHNVEDLATPFGDEFADLLLLVHYNRAVALAHGRQFSAASAELRILLAQEHALSHAMAINVRHLMAGIAHATCNSHAALPLLQRPAEDITFDQKYMHHLLKARLLCRQGELKDASKELTLAAQAARAAMASDVTLLSTDCAAFAEAQALFLSGNLQQALEKLNSVPRSQDLQETACYLNNLGCINAKMGNKHIAALHFFNALALSTPKLHSVIISSFIQDDPCE